MKKLLLVLPMVALLGACVHGGVAPRQDDPCPQGQYWSTTSQACQEWPKSM
jgi:hypothetical protein